MLTFLIGGFVVFVAWAIVAGPDLNWDLLNYHLYVGFHASGDAIARDYFAAGAPTYLAPYAYWPLALMVAARWPAVVVASILAAIHSLCLIATWVVAKQVLPGESLTDAATRGLAVVIAVVCPLVMTQIGTSFIDINAAVPIVIGVGLLLRGLVVPSLRIGCLAVAGASFGIGVAVKLTGAPFAIAGLLALMTAWLLRPDIRLAALIAFGLGMVVGFIAVYGYWGMQLWREFHNPFFPLYQGVFEPAVAASSVPQAAMPAADSSGILHSIRDWLSSTTNRHQRFIPRSLSDWILRPLYMIDPVANVYTEVRAPDARFLALFCLAPLALWNLRRGLTATPLFWLLLIFGLSWAMWMATSGNGRYMMPLALVAGPAIVACGRAIWPRGGVLALGAIAILAFVQAALLLEGTQFRWAPTQWQKQFISAQLPREVTDHPATFVTFDGQSASWLAVFVDRTSRFANPGGPQHRNADGTSIDRFEQILGESKEIVAIFKFYYYELDGKTPYPASPANMGVTAEAVGLTVDFDTCKTGQLVETDEPRVGVFWHNGKKVERIGVQGFFFCRATFNPGLKRETPADPLRDAAIANIERKCPGQFPPGGAGTICAATACWRAYSATDTTLIITTDGSVLSRFYGAFQEPYLGNISELSHDTSRLVCNEELGRYAPWSPGENLLSKTPRPLR